MVLTYSRFAVALSMSLWNESARWALRTCLAFFLAVPALASPEVPPDALQDVSTDISTPSPPTTVVPLPPRPIPDIAPVHFSTGHGSPPADPPPIDRQTLSFSPAFRSGGAVSFRPGGFSVRLLSRMSREAGRYRRASVSQSWDGIGIGPGEELDSIAAARRSTEASRVITRSTHRALDEELERAARSTLGLGSTLDLLQNLSLRRARAGTTHAAPPPRGEGASSSQSPGSTLLRADVALRLDAHPALLLRAQFKSLRGRIELPVRGEPFRFSLESPVGPRGRAVLSSGLPREGRGWATLTLSFGF